MNVIVKAEKNLIGDLQDVKNEQQIFISFKFQDLIKQFRSLFFESQVYENKKIPKQQHS